MVQACLIGLIASLGVFGDQLGSLYINRPIILAPLVGLVLGNLHQGLIIGASLELFFMGAVSIGAYVPPDTIVGGVPARPIRKRFDEEVIRKLETLKWWDWPAEKIRHCLPYIVNGDIDNLLDYRE